MIIPALGDDDRTPLSLIKLNHQRDISAFALSSMIQATRPNAVDGGQPQSANPISQRWQAPLRMVVGMSDWMIDGGWTGDDGMRRRPTYPLLELAGG